MSLPLIFKRRELLCLHNQSGFADTGTYVYSLAKKVG